MKLRKKIIILVILFLFGFGVFFGTFAKGGYFVNAADLNSDILGTCEKEKTTDNDDDYYIVYELHGDNSTDYYLSIKIYNNVYPYIYEDYHIDSFLSVWFWCDSGDGGFARGLNGNLDKEDFTPYSTNIEDYTEDDDIVLEIDFYYDLSTQRGTPAYIYIYSIFEAIYFDATGGAPSYNDELTDEEGLYCYSYDLAYTLYNQGYNYAYDIAYDLGYDDGYYDGHEDGYDEGYTLGETAGYNDGLDIGYYNGYEVGHYDGYTEGEAYGYSTGLDEGYETGLDEGLRLSGYKEAYEKGIAKAENTATTWFKGIFEGFQGFFNIRLGGITIGGIILIPLSITFAWFIIRQFRGGGGGD